MTSHPRILSIETSGRQGSVAVALGPTLLTQRPLPPTARHAIELMPAIRELTREQGWQPADIDHLYLSLGPGSFTGLRIAVTIARAMHQAIGVKLVGVPSLDVIAHNAPPDCNIVLPILDAKRAQVFSARYERAADRPEGLLQTAAPALVDPGNFVQEAIHRAEQMLAGSESKIENQNSKLKIALLGEGLDYHRPALCLPTLPNVELLELDKSLWPGQAATVHRLGYALALQDHFSNPATLLPLYIRLPEAEEVYRKKHGLLLQ